MKIKINTFATVRDICGFEERDMSIPSNYSVGDAIQKLMEEVNDLKSIKNKLLFAINDEYCDDDRILSEGDKLAIFPPVSGG